MKHVNILVFLLSAVGYLVEPASAEENIPYCDPSEKYAPHGIVLKMADAYYRACLREGTFLGINSSCGLTPHLSLSCSLNIHHLIFG